MKITGDNYVTLNVAFQKPKTQAARDSLTQQGAAAAESLTQQGGEGADSLTRLFGGR